MKIDFLVGENPYGTTPHFAKSLAAALEKEGAQVRLFWVGEGHFFHAFYAALRDPPTLTCSFSDITLEGRSLGNLWSIPHLSLLVDPPLYFLPHLRTKRSWITCVDQHDLAFVHHLGHPEACFLPHAADPQVVAPVKGERPYEAVFFGTCIDYEAVASSWDPQERPFLLDACERVLSPTGLSIWQVLQEYALPADKLAFYHHTVDLYTRGRDRVELIRSLKGRRVDVWGEGPWERYVPDATLHPPVDFTTALTLMQKSRLVLNSAPRFKAGGHERIFYALAAGASVYTGENPFVKTEVPGCYLYPFGQWHPPDLSDWQQRAEEGQAHVLAHHTYSQRAATLLNFLESCSLQGK